MTATCNLDNYFTSQSIQQGGGDESLIRVTIA